MRARRGRVVRQDLWPGFVDALASLLMVVIFLLSVFALAQHFLGQRLSGREEALTAAEARLAAADQARVAALAEAARLGDALSSMEARLTARAAAAEIAAGAREEIAAEAAQLEDALAHEMAARKKAEEALARARTDATDATARAGNLAAGLAGLTAEKDKLAAAFAAAEHASHEAASQATARVEALERELADALAAGDAAAALAKTRALEIARLVAGLDAGKAAAATDRAAHAAEAEQLSASRKAETERADQMQAALAAALTRAEQAEGARDALAERLAGLVDVNAAATVEYRQRIARLEAEIADLTARTAALQDAAAAAETGLIQARKAAAGLEAQQTDADAERRRVSALNAELQAKVDQLNAALDAALGDAEARGATILQLRGRLNAALAAKVGELQRFRSEFFGKLKEAIGDRRDIRIEGDRFVLQSEVLFETAKAEIGPSGRADLDALARSLKEIMAVIPADIDWVLRIDGHTDVRPIFNQEFSSNRDLSVARAIAVAEALAAEGVPEARLLPAGFGEYRPLDPANTPEAYKRNRRIEIKLTQR